MVSKEKFQKEIGQRIRAIREAKGISIMELEAMDGSLDKSDLSKIENGHKAPALYTLYRIANLLEEEISTFFTKDQIKERRKK